MKRTIHKIEEYRDISNDVWRFFKKYFPMDADLDGIADDIHLLDQKYKPDVRQYCFMQRLLKVYFDELNELNELRGKKNGDTNKS